MNQPYLINRREAKIMGVAAGLADWSGVNVLAVRLSLIVALLLTGPVVVLLYLLTGWLAPDR